MTHIPQPKLSSVTKKLLTGATGLALVLFLVVHLIGNFTLYAGPQAFNVYANFLHHFLHGGLIWFARIGLLTFFVVHIWAGVQVQLSKLKARPSPYVVEGYAGGPSKKSKHSLNMAISGGILLLFVIVHLNHFTIGVEKEWFTTSDGTQIPNVYKMVVASFQGNFLIVLFYMACMAVLCSHLMHGIWSALQSVGATRPSTIPFLHSAGVAIAIALALGFFLLPLMIFLLRDKFDANALAPVLQHARLSTLPWTQV